MQIEQKRLPNKNAASVKILTIHLLIDAVRRSMAYKYGYHNNNILVVIFLSKKTGGHILAFLKALIICQQTVQK